MSTHIINFPGADIHTTTITSVSNVSVGENLDVTSNLTVSGNTAVSQELSVSGNVEVGTANLFVDTTTGNVGVGVAHPMSAKLQVAGSLGMAKGSEFFAGDDVVMELPKHDRPLVKYPEVAMTAASTGGYTVDASTYNAQYYPFKALNGLKGASSGDVGWYTGSSDYTGTSNVYVGTERLSSETDLGEWITIELPNPIKLVETHLWTQFNYFHVPKGGVFYGKRNASDTWTQLYSYTENPIKDQYSPQIHIINETRYFKYFAYVATEKYSSDAGIAVGEWELYGHEEGDTSVDVVHRSIPNKPGQQHLEVYWDANDSNSYSFADSSNVYDLSGSGVTGTITGTNSFDAEYNAWVFDGSGDYISGTLSNPAGDWVHSVSCWVSATELSSTKARFITHYGVEALRQQVILSLTPGRVRVDFNSDSIYKDVSPFVLNTWYHIAFTYSGGGTSNVKIYINGVDVGVSGGGTTALNIASGRTLYVGKELNLAYNDPWKGSIANFRLFGGKVLNADQVRELYEYDAPRFGHRQNLVSLHKGNLGVGVTHPTSRFEVAGDETLQEYPPRAIRVFDYQTHIEGHGNFNFYSSQNNPYYLGSSTWDFTKMFENTTTAGSGWHGGVDGLTSPGMYQAVAVYAPAVTSGDGLVKSILKDGSVVYGEWVDMHTPYAINVTSVVTAPRQNYGNSRGIGKFVILGSNNGADWEHAGSGAIAPHDNSGSAGGYGTKGSETPAYVSTNSNGHFYTYHRLVVTHIMGHRADSTHPNYSSTANEPVNQSYLRFFGTPAPSSLEDGHLTLGKALTTPRVSGHAAGAETPRAESLVVHYDTTVDSVASGSRVVDTSGTGSNGTLNGDAAYSSSDRALTFDGTGDFVKGTIPSSLSGNDPYSFSMWVKPNTIQSGYIAAFEMGNRTNNQSCALYLNGGAIVHASFGNNLQATTSVTANQWMHIVGTYTSGSRKVYADGVLLASDSYSSLNIGATEMTLGANNDDSQEFNGSISNFKLWDVAVTAAEVAAEYALGRTGKSLNITDTAVCLGGTVPRAQLDVRGGARFDGRVGVGAANPICMLDVRKDGGARLRLENATGSYSGQNQALEFCTTYATTGFVHQKGEHLRLGTTGGQSQIRFYTVNDTGYPNQDGSSMTQSFFDETYTSGNDSPRMTINNSGNVGIGTTSPDTRLTLKQSEQSASGGFQIQRSENTSSWQIYINANGTDLYFAYNGTTKGYLDRVNSAGLIDFTGQHRSFIYDVPYSKYTELEGLIVSANKNKYFTIGENIHTGSNAIQISESLPLVSLSTKEKDKACFGVISGSEDPDSREYAQGSFVSVVQKQKGDRRAFINSVGEGAMWVTDINGPLESGDYITTSNVAGYGQGQDDDILHNYTVAKITMDCDFNPPDIPVQRILKELSNVNYWVKTTYSDVSLEEYSNLAEENRTTTTETVYTNEDDEITTDKYNTLESNVQSTYTELTRIIHQKMSTEEYKTEQEGTTLEVRQELVNVLDEHGQLQWEDTDETEKAYKIRYLDASGQQTDEANAVHVAAFVGVTYHCG